jgi:hypothetical protein
MPEKTPAQKLLIKAGETVSFVHPPKDLTTLLGPLPQAVQVIEHPHEPLDFILLFADTRQVLEADLPRLKDALKPAGNLWVGYHKGTSGVKSDINRDSIRDYAASVGMETVALISLDADWSAMRLKRGR